MSRLEHEFRFCEWTFVRPFERIAQLYGPCLQEEKAGRSDYPGI